MKNQLTIIILLFTSYCSAQFDCANIELLGIYDNNVHSSHLSLIFTNSSTQNDGNESKSTSILHINNVGDTIGVSGPNFKLPKSEKDTFVYNVPIHENYNWIGDLPMYNEGRIITDFPYCELEYYYNSVSYENKPYTPLLDCTDFKVAGLYESAKEDNLNYSMLIVNTNSDSLRGWPLGYTGFQLLDVNDEPLSEPTTPGYIVPTYGDTLIVHLNILDPLLNEEIKVKMVAPDCTLNYTKNLVVSSNVKSEVEIVKIFPNPCFDWLFIDSADKNEFNYRIYNQVGQKVMTSKSKTIDVSGLTTGIYFIEVRTDEFRLFEKIVKY